MDERDGRKKPRKVLGPTPESVQEDRSGEFVHHPADVVYAAMTIQRFFKKIKQKKDAERKRNAKKSKRIESKDSSATESSNTSTYDEESSKEDPEVSDSSDENSQKKLYAE